jgi:hypothetical protein
MGVPHFEIKVSDEQLFSDKPLFQKQKHLEIPWLGLFVFSQLDEFFSGSLQVFLDKRAG